MNRVTHSLLAGVLLLRVSTFPAAARDASPSMPVPDSTLSRLGNHSLRVTTKSPAAQRAFDRGLILSHAFGHEAAAEEFAKAAKLDPNMAMAWWGIALVNGPHINFPMVPPDKAQAAWDALGKAQALAASTSEVERALIKALASRYANPQPEDRGPLDQAYADAMRKVWSTHPRNADVGCLFAESLMDLHPWDFWTIDGQARPWTGEIVATLDEVLKINPRHPGANHLLIHTVEASPHPEKALAAANRLRTLVPGSSHLVHMPSHIYARVGQWNDAAASNVSAMKVDKLYRAAHPNPGFYAIYMTHNAHFLAFIAMMRGNAAETIRLGRQMVAGMPPEFLQNFAPIVDGYMIFVSEALMRFGHWEEVLAEPRPPEGLPLSLALWHFTRAAAFNALGRVDDANKERATFMEAATKVPDGYTFGNSSAADLLAIASHVLDGEIAARAGKYDEAITNLREAVKIEDTLRYDEPPDWIQPVRHALGAVLLRAGKPAEAEAVYRADLRRYPENGWSLFGLGESLKQQGKAKAASASQRRFARVWNGADIKITSTCLCLPADK